jgi:hypothetical protein
MKLFTLLLIFSAFYSVNSQNRIFEIIPICAKLEQSEIELPITIVLSDSLYSKFSEKSFFNQRNENSIKVMSISQAFFNHIEYAYGIDTLITKQEDFELCISRRSPIDGISNLSRSKVFFFGNLITQRLDSTIVSNLETDF